VKSRNSSQCNGMFLVMAVRPGKKFGFQSSAENLCDSTCRWGMTNYPMDQNKPQWTTTDHNETTTDYNNGEDDTGPKNDWTTNMMDKKNLWRYQQSRLKTG